jgi:hypothetical protein
MLMEAYSEDDDIEAFNTAMDEYKNCGLGYICSDLDEHNGLMDEHREDV